MKKRATSGTARSQTGWHKHLDVAEQRRANRGTRQAAKRALVENMADALQIVPDQVKLLFDRPSAPTL
jgi:hypothetical protein